MLKILLTLWYPLPCFDSADSATNWEYTLICLSDNILSFVSLYGGPRCEVMQMTLAEFVLIVLPQVIEGLIIAGVIIHQVVNPFMDVLLPIIFG
jgi:hypothetical protein